MVRLSVLRLTFIRPQYDDSAIAVIITKEEKAKRYEKMMSGEEVLESWLGDRLHFCERQADILSAFT